MVIVTIAGTAGSGKSTLAKLLAKKLGFRHHSVGDGRRAIAEEKGISLKELNKLSETGEFDSDTPVDMHMKKLGETEDDLVIDCRTGFHFVPKSIKIFLDAEKATRAERLLNRKSVGERPTSLEDAMETLDIHRKSERKRYMNYYKIDIWDQTHYDLVLDSTHLSPEELVERILKQFPELKEGEK